MKPKWTITHTVMGVGLTAVLALLTALANDPSLASWALPLAAFLTALGHWLGWTSGKAFGKGPPTGPVLILLTMCGVGTVTSSCLPANFPSANFPSDVLAVYACVKTEVEAGDTNVGKIILACKAPEEAVVLDAINALLDSKQWVAQHPEKVSELVRMRGELMRGAR
jgi:hypothetical protein